MSVRYFTQFGIFNICWFEYAKCTLTIPTYVGVDPWGFIEWREVCVTSSLNNKNKKNSGLTINYNAATTDLSSIPLASAADNREGRGQHRRETPPLVVVVVVVAVVVVATATAVVFCRRRRPPTGNP